ncbi:putative histidine kinase sensor protein [Trichinella spiralis]|uniref:putative histidine kinase sensor protein n=1 Tax=Trichinella spiralis TaxID=6334 RepID=UPI0001EFD3B8|nr:putative histidine kinase sensor protein [Trichinella spiralis]
MFPVTFNVIENDTHEKETQTTKHSSKNQYYYNFTHTHTVTKNIFLLYVTDIQMESETTTMRFQFLSSMMGFNRTSSFSCQNNIEKTACEPASAESAPRRDE